MFLRDYLHTTLPASMQAVKLLALGSGKQEEPAAGGCGSTA
jgi:hypothetical protein